MRVIQGCFASLPLLFLLFAGCTPSSSPLPTAISVAAVPVEGEATRSLPATYTPHPPATATPSVTSTRPPTHTPMTLVSATPAPLPPLAPERLVTRSAEAPFLERPPQAVACGGPGTLFRSRFPSALAGPWRSYHAYLPPCYRRDGRSFPVLYLFHGSIQTDSHWLDLGLFEHVDRSIRNGRYPPFIVIMPFNDRLGNVTSGGKRSIEAITVDELIPFVDDTFCTWVDAAGRGMGGISRGGYWALMIAFRHPDLISAVAGHSSHLRLETDPAQYNPLVTYAQADLSRMRIWLDWGEEDFLRAGQRQLHAALTEAGVSHQARVNDGSHNELYWMTHLGEYLDWHTAVWPHDRQHYPFCTHR